MGLQENLRKPRKLLGIDVRSTKKEIFNRKQPNAAKAAKKVGMVLTRAASWSFFEFSVAKLVQR
jgi:hypothetical protein